MADIIHGGRDMSFARFHTLNLSRPNERGMTLIEIVIIIAVMGILFSVAVPAYKDMITDAKISACKAGLGSLRVAIQQWQAARALSLGTATWPVLDSVAAPGVIVEQAIPPNPFQADANAPDSVVEGFVRGVVVGTRGGWAYKPSTGEIWPNTSTVIGGSGCGGSTTINENSW